MINIDKLISTGLVGFGEKIFGCSFIFLVLLELTLGMRTSSVSSEFLMDRADCGQKSGYSDELCLEGRNELGEMKSGDRRYWSGVQDVLLV